MAENTATTIRTGKYETYLNRSGEGNEEAILFLHGSGPGVVSWSNWQFAMPVLGERYDCLAPDLIGFGKSEHPEEPPEGMNAWMDAWIEQNIALLDDLGLGRVHIVGNSMGGAIALPPDTPPPRSHRTRGADGACRTSTPHHGSVGRHLGILRGAHRRTHERAHRLVRLRSQSGRRRRPG